MTDHHAPSLAERGRAARSRRATIRHDITTGTISVPDLLEGHGEESVEAEALNMTVAVLVGAVPGLGPEGVERVLSGRCGHARRLGELTTRTRHEIAEAVRKESTP